MTRKELTHQIRDKQSFLCVGLDPDLTRLPRFFLDFEDPVFEFNKRVIDATKDFCVAYKPNVAFYEALGTGGWQALAKTLDYIPETHFTIADAKRGDIGNTSRLYATTFFQTFDFDAVTIAPYMGEDSVAPFLEFKDRWVILLALTSNAGSSDFQFYKNDVGKPLFQHVIERAMTWGDSNNLMFVVGATQGTHLRQIRTIAPDHFLLVPGVGAQGGDLSTVVTEGKNQDIGLLVNASRSIIFAGTEAHDFDHLVSSAAKSLQSEMSILLL
ncbi:MAG: orotidine-5'-phosphate decarboxylase [Saprospiraceae bacterium]|nr:orotidine-5'-phosphate decarboxylase [Saprospiraceae bacterium]